MIEIQYIYNMQKMCVAFMKRHENLLSCGQDLPILGKQNCKQQKCISFILFLFIIRFNCYNNYLLLYSTGIRGGSTCNQHSFALAVLFSSLQVCCCEIEPQ